MKRHSFAASLALAVSAVLGLIGPVAAGEQVPFKGSFDGVDTVTAVNPPFISVEVDATGNATQLGEFTLTIQGTVDTRTMSGTGGIFLFTAANGDTVFGIESGQATLTAPGVLTIVSNGIITGGTGRFADSTGSYTSTRLKDLVTGATTASFEGTISSPGS
jgi:hypothetical protein